MTPLSCPSSLLRALAVSTSFFAVLAGAVLPGDWGFFTSCECPAWL